MGHSLTSFLLYPLQSRHFFLIAFNGVSLVILEHLARLGRMSIMYDGNQNGATKRTGPLCENVDAHRASSARLLSRPGGAQPLGLSTYTSLFRSITTMPFSPLAARNRLVFSC